MSVIIITLIVLLIVQSMGMIYMKKYVITIQTCNWAGLIIVNHNYGGPLVPLPFQL